MAEWFKAAVLKTVRAKAHVGSNPTASDFQKVSFALGMAMGLIYRYALPIANQTDKGTIDKINTVVFELFYGRKSDKGKVRK